MQLWASPLGGSVGQLAADRRERQHLQLQPGKHSQSLHRGINSRPVITLTHSAVFSFAFLITNENFQLLRLCRDVKRVRFAGSV